MKLEIKTKKPDVIEEALKTLVKDVEKQSEGKIKSSYKKLDSDKFYLCLDFPKDNRLANYIIKKAFSSSLKKLDKDIKIGKYKKGGL